MIALWMSSPVTFLAGTGLLFIIITVIGEWIGKWFK